MDTEFLVVAGVAVVLLVGLFNLLIIASLAGKLSRVQDEAKQQEKLNHDLYRAVSTLYSQNKQVLDLENQATHVLGTVSGHTQQMLDDSRKIHGKLEAVSTQTTQMLQFDQDLNKELGKVQEATRHIISIKDDISSLHFQPAKPAAVVPKTWPPGGSPVERAAGRCAARRQFCFAAPVRERHARRRGDQTGSAHGRRRFEVPPHQLRAHACGYPRRRTRAAGETVCQGCAQTRGRHCDKVHHSGRGHA